MLNNIVLLGRMTRDPELRQTAGGVSVTTFTLAVDRDYAPQGQDRETDFIDCVAWRGTAEFVAKYFVKGSMAAVFGRLQIRNWTDREGNRRRSAEVAVEHVYFGGSKPAGQSTPAAGPANGYPNDFSQLADDDSEFPF